MKFLEYNATVTITRFFIGAMERVLDLDWRAVVVFFNYQEPLEYQ
jgi:hypothetical protein